MKFHSLIKTTIYTVITAFLFSFFTVHTLAREEVTLFYQDDCPQCDKALELLDSVTFPEEDIKIEKVRLSTIPNKQKFITVTEVCKMDKNEIGVPMLATTDGQCYVGIEKPLLYITFITGIDIPNLKESAQEFEKEFVNVDVDELAGIEKEDEKENLSDSLEKEGPKKVEKSPISAATVVMFIIPPTIFLIIAYLLISRLKL